jgi:protein-S-isoprenylcysteine O-methyltransferase Ste14
MERRGINAYFYFAAAMVTVAAATLFVPWPWGLMMCLMMVFIFVVESLILRFSQPEVLRRRLSPDNWWDKALPPLTVLFAAASAALSAYDIGIARISMLPVWCILLGIALVLSAFVVLAQALKSQAPHAVEKYGEKPAEGMERGPYEVVRHPVMLSVLLGGLSIPLLMGSGIGFAPVGLMIAAVVARVAAEDDWRFNNYEWYYDYTKEVSYRLIPFIW